MALSACVILGTLVLVLKIQSAESTKRICRCSPNTSDKQIRGTVERMVHDEVEGIAGVRVADIYALPCTDKDFCEIELLDFHSRITGYCVNLKGNIRGEPEVIAQGCITLRPEFVTVDTSANYYTSKTINGKAVSTQSVSICKNADYCNAAPNLHPAGLTAADMLGSVAVALFFSYY